MLKLWVVAYPIWYLSCYYFKRYFYTSSTQTLHHHIGNTSRMSCPTLFDLTKSGKKQYEGELITTPIWIGFHGLLSAVSWVKRIPSYLSNPVQVVIGLLSLRALHISFLTTGVAVAVSARTGTWNIIFAPMYMWLTSQEKTAKKIFYFGSRGDTTPKFLPRINRINSLPDNFYINKQQWKSTIKLKVHFRELLSW